MAKCDFCGKGVVFGIKVSHSHRRANRTWKDVDQKALKEVEAMLDEDHKNTLYMYLTEASRYAVEEFVGQLPPYTKFNNFVYRMSQLGLTATENNKAL